jgi:hypothetical protein
VQAAFRAGPATVGLGVVTNSVARARITNGGAGIPFVDVFTQGDVMVPVVASYEIGGPLLAPLQLAFPYAPSSVALGLQVTGGRRYISAYANPIDAIDPDETKLYVLSVTGFSVDAGVHARDLGLPGLDLGIAVRNLLGASINPTFDRSWDISENNAPDDAQEIARLETRFADRNPGPVARVGLAYRVPVPPTPGLNIDRVVVSADYVGASTSEFEQSTRAGLRAGASARIAGILDLRAGFSQTAPTAGAALTVPGFSLSYSWYTVEDGRLLGSAPRQAHMATIRFGLQ